MVLKKTILLALLVLVVAASATETTWKHSGFEVWGYDINLTGQYNVTEVRTLEFALNSSAPPLSGTDRAVVYYGSDDKLKVSENGGAYSNLVSGGGNASYPINLSNESQVANDLADSHLSTNVPLLNVDNVFTGSGAGTQMTITGGGIDSLLISSSGALSGVDLQNTGIGGKDWAIGSTSVGASAGAGNLTFFDGTADRMVLNSSTGLDVKGNINGSISANSIDRDTLADARLSANVPLLDAAFNNFTGAGNRFPYIGINRNTSVYSVTARQGASAGGYYIEDSTGTYAANYRVSDVFGTKTAEISLYDTTWLYAYIAKSTSDIEGDLRNGASGSVLVAGKFAGDVTTAGFTGNGSALTALNAGNLASGTVPAAILGTNLNTSGVNFIIDGSSSAITTGIKGDVEVPFSGTITTARLFADQSGSIAVSVEKDTYANFPPTLTDQIGNFTLSSATKSENTSVSVAVTAGDVIRFNVSSASTVQRVTASLTIQKS